MSEKITFKIFLKTVILFPFFMIFVFSPLMISIVLTSFLPNGRHLATQLYEFFGWVGLKFVGVNLIVEGAEKIDISKNLAFTCGSGITACVLGLANSIISGKKPLIYDGSWAEYGLN